MDILTLFCSIIFPHLKTDNYTGLKKLYRAHESQTQTDRQQINKMYFTKGVTKLQNLYRIQKEEPTFTITLKNEKSLMALISQLISQGFRHLTLENNPAVPCIHN